MKIKIVAVGQKMPAWVQTGYEEYRKRMPKDYSVQLVELSLAPRGKNYSVDKAKQQEAQTIAQAVKECDRVVALDVLGKPLTTEALSQKMANWQMDVSSLAIIIGGPDGLAPECLKSASERWSLSGLTLPHPMVRIVLIEQLYRAWTIIQNHPYHK